MRCAVMGKQPESQAFSTLLALPPFRSKQACGYSSQAESRFLIAQLSVPLVFKPAEGTHLPGVGPQGWGTQYVIQTTNFPRRLSEPV